MTLRVLVLVVLMVSLLTLSVKQSAATDPAPADLLPAPSLAHLVKTLPSINGLPAVAPVIHTPLSNLYTIAASLLVTGTASPLAPVTIVHNGIALLTTTVTASGAFSVTVPLVEGQQTITAQRADSIGSPAKQPSAIQVTRDTMAPVITGWAYPDLVQPGANVQLRALIIEATHREAVQVRVIVDNRETWPLQLRAGVWEWSQSANPAPIAEGKHTLTFAAIDLVGNTGVTTTTLIIDGTAPAGQLTVSPAANHLAVTWQVQDALSGLHRCEVELNGQDGTWLPLSNVCAGDLLVRRVATQAYQVRLRASDRVGNELVEISEIPGS